MKIRTMNLIALTINLIAVILCTVLVFVNIYSGIYIWAIINVLLAFINATFAFESVKRLRDERFRGL